ncbi:MAG TPA: 3-oxoacyl-ACP synthase, partial [Streptomyces sp.]|nr:3-oxoacyl-ACP synthase [Streptomyces sp.]
MKAARGTSSAAVTGVGLVTAAGIGAEQTWHQITRSTLPSGVGPHPALEGMPCDFAYTVGGFDSDALLGVATSRLMDRFSQMAVVAAREAVA